MGNIRERERAHERRRTRTVRDTYRDLLLGGGSILRKNGALMANSYGEGSLASMTRS